jgi:hypothetical protein
VTESDRNLYVSMIVAGHTVCRIEPYTFYVRQPSRTQNLLAEHIYQEQYEEAIEGDALSDQNLRSFLLKQGIWSKEDDSTLKILDKNIETQKIALYENFIDDIAVKKIRELLDISRKEHNRLSVLLHSYDYISATGIAQSAKHRYLLGCSVYYKDGRPYWEDEEEGWKAPDIFFNKILLCVNKRRPTEPMVRELARNEPWKSVWNSQKYCGKGVLNVAAADLTIEQKSLIIWSSVYDSVREHPESPSDSIIDDDDALDGWMLSKRKQSEQEKFKKSGKEMITNPRIKNSSEIFMMARNEEHAGKIFDMNDPGSKMIMQQRINTVRNSEGAVQEQDLPDNKLRIAEEYQKRFSEHIKRGRR